MSPSSVRCQTRGGKGESRGTILSRWCFSQAYANAGAAMLAVFQATCHVAGRSQLLHFASVLAVLSAVIMCSVFRLSANLAPLVV